MKTLISVQAATLLATLGLATPSLAMAPPMHSIQQGNRATRALNALEASGYADFTHFHRVGMNYAANVTRNGRMIHVLVAPETGTVTVQS